MSSKGHLSRARLINGLSFYFLPHPNLRVRLFSLCEPKANGSLKIHGSHLDRGIRYFVGLVLQSQVTLSWWSQFSPHPHITKYVGIIIHSLDF